MTERNDGWFNKEAFRKGHCSVLVATDVAARGIDVDGVTHVVHFDVPRSTEDYIHRSGRTGRAGASGQVITFAAPDESRDLGAIEAAIGGPIKRYSLRGFDDGLDDARPRPRGDSSSRPSGRR